MKILLAIWMVLAACGDDDDDDVPDGSGGIADARGLEDATPEDATDAEPLECTEAFVDGFNRTCTERADCVAVLHQTDCCGNARWFGIRASELTRFRDQDETCNMMWPDCQCASRPPVADDDNPVTDGNTPPVRCMGTCSTYVE